MGDAPSRILVVEDDESMRELIALWLPDEYRVALVESAGRAIAHLAHHAVDILITDFNMPDMDGLDLLRWCRAGGLHLPVIFMTASRALFPREEIALGDCCSELLAKPFDRATFLSALETASRRRHDHDCLGRTFSNERPISTESIDHRPSPSS